MVCHVARPPAAFGVQPHSSALPHTRPCHLAGFVVGIPAGLLDIGTVSNLSNIGTLFAFVLVSIGVLILRYREPERHRAFRAPFGPVIPVLSIVFCVVLMTGLEVMTWLRFFGWLVIGLLIYAFYSRKRSEFAS
jgi:APA family basic amino acid/polyamine antiporter